jgi:hypothetical protein
MSIVNAIICYNLQSYKDSQITFVDEDTTNNFGKIKLVRLDPRVITRSSTGGGNFKIIIDYGTATVVRALYIGNHNFLFADTMLFRAGNSPPPAVAAKSQDITPGASNQINLSHRITDLTSGVDDFWKYRYFWLDITTSASFVELGAFVMFENYMELPLNIEGFRTPPRGYRNQNLFTGFTSHGVFSTPRYIPFRSADINNTAIANPQTPPVEISEDRLIQAAGLSDYVLFWPDGTNFSDISRKYFGTIQFEDFRWLNQAEGAGVTRWQGNGVFQSIDVTAAEKLKWERLSA